MNKTNTGTTALERRCWEFSDPLNRNVVCSSVLAPGSRRCVLDQAGLVYTEDHQRNRQIKM